METAQKLTEMPSETAQKLPGDPPETLQRPIGNPRRLLEIKTAPRKHVGFPKTARNLFQMISAVFS